MTTKTPAFIYGTILLALAGCAMLAGLKRTATDAHPSIAAVREKRSLAPSIERRAVLSSPALDQYNLQSNELRFRGLVKKAVLTNLEVQELQTLVQDRLLAVKAFEALRSSLDESERIHAIDWISAALRESENPLRERIIYEATALLRGVSLSALPNGPEFRSKVADRIELGDLLSNIAQSKGSR